jgi:hypothetical protein
MNSLTSIFWDIKSCSPLKVNRRFGGTYQLHLQGRKINPGRYQRERKWQAELDFHAGVLLGLFLDPEDGTGIFLQNVS